jgi:mannose-6-phosphate isomerase-like protein (cupin superfamily)
MVIKKSTATPIKVNERSTIWDYPMPSEDTGLSYQNLNGRLPEKGWYINRVCHEIFFITKGTAKFNIENKNYDLTEGDAVILKPRQKHYGIYSNTSLITITSPNWFEEQCEVIEN